MTSLFAIPKQAESCSILCSYIAVNNFTVQVLLRLPNDVMKPVFLEHVKKALPMFLNITDFDCRYTGRELFDDVAALQGSLKCTCCRRFAHKPSQSVMFFCNGGF